MNEQIQNDIVDQIIQQTNQEQNIETQNQNQTVTQDLDKQTQNIYNFSQENTKQEDSSKHKENETKQIEKEQQNIGSVSYSEYRNEYWNKTIPIVAKEIGISEDEIRKMCEEMLIDSPDLIVELRNIISLPKKTLIVNEITKTNNNTEKKDEKIQVNDWLKIAEMIKKDRKL